MENQLLHSKTLSLLMVVMLLINVGNNLYAQKGQIVTGEKYQEEMHDSQLKIVDGIVQTEIRQQIDKGVLAYRQGKSRKTSLKSAMGTAVSETDSLALVALYDATNGASWTNNTNWRTEEPIDSWFGVTVVDDAVTELRLNSNNLSGIIPVELGNLTNLEFLYLNGNQLTDTIPAQLGNLTNLALLYLNGNQLTGTIPVELGDLPNLQWFDLGNNQLTGDIPVEIGQLTALQFLDFNNNLLSGTIPAEVNDLTNLQWLVLTSNQLTGSIQIETDALPNLEMLYLNENQLTGPVPSELNELVKLKWLHLGTNEFSGSIPVELIALDSLELLYLDDNLLTGTIPGELGQMTSLRWLNLGKNQLTGTISTDLCSPNFSLLYLNNNQLTGSIPVELGQMTNLEWLYLNSNKLTGSIPAEISNLSRLKIMDVKSNQLDSIPDITAPDSLMVLNVSNNKFTFEDLEYNMDLLLPVDTVYSPQDSIGAIETFTKNSGDNFSYTLSTGGTQNIYKWYKDGVALDLQTDSILVIDNLTTADAGNYYCEVTNALVPGLTLTSREIKLLVKSCIKIVFTAGWNIFSSPVMPDSTDMEQLFQPFIDNESLVKIQDEEAKNLEDWGVYGGWINNIGDIAATEGYKTKMSIKDSVEICGVPVEYPYEIALKQGWNIIGYPQTLSFDGMDVVQTLIDKKVLIKVQNEKGRTIEDWGVYGGWINYIEDFVPGEGYKIKVSKDTSMWIYESYPKSGEILQKVVASTHFLPAFEGNGIDHMNINLVNLSESEIMVGDEIGVFDGNICVGATKITSQNQSIVNLIASADEGKDEPNGFSSGNYIYLKLFRNGQDFPLTFTTLNNASTQFEKNATLFLNVNGDLNTGIELPENEFNLALYPNPFNEIINIEIKLQQRQELTVEVYDLLSRRVVLLHKGDAEGIIKLQWDGNNSNGNRVVPGIYVCRVNGVCNKVFLNGR
jgi:Leucine-rich repeat (LRR) protein